MRNRPRQTSWHSVLRCVVLVVLLPVLLAQSMDEDTDVAPAASASSGLDIVDAVRVALVANLDGYLSAEGIVAKEATLQQVRSVFDPVISTSVSRSRLFTPLSEGDQPAYIGGRQVTDSTGYNVAYNQLLRSGIALKHQITFEKTDTNLEAQTEIPNRGRISSGVVIPLVKGKGRRVVAAEVFAAELELEADSLRHAHALSLVASTTAKAFWDYLGVITQQHVYGQSVDRARKLLEDTKLLVEADEVPRAELDGLEANVAQKMATSIGAERSLTSSKHNLALLMGLAAQADIDSLPSPSGDFPAWDNVLERLHFEHDHLIRLALQNRQDLQAQQRLLAAAQKRVQQARDNLRPDLNLELEVGFSGYENSNDSVAMLDALHRNGEGVDLAAQIVYRWPVGNHEAEGLYRSAMSALRNVEIETEKLERQIRSDVQVALLELINSIRQLHEIHRSLQLYERAVVGEKTKFSLGVSTLLDVIQIEDRLTDAYIQMIGAQQAYASALIEFRLVLGVLIRVSDQAVSILGADLHVLPYEHMFAEQEGKQL